MIKFNQCWFGVCPLCNKKFRMKRRKEGFPVITKICNECEEDKS